MKLQRTIKDHWAEQRLFGGRLLVALVIATLMALGLMSRLIQLQVVEYQKYEELSRGNRLRLEAQPPTRGIIYDRHGEVLAENRPRFQLELTRERVKDLDDTLTRLAKAKFIDVDQIEKLKNTVQKEYRPFVAVPLRYRLNENEVARFAALRPQFPGVDFEARLTRFYPHAELTAHAVGYMGRINASEQARIDKTRYAGSRNIGKSGIEHAFENHMHGEVGYETVLVNATGRPLRRTQQDAPTPGNNVHLTLDLNLQRVAYEAMQGQSGSVVAMDPNTGAIRVWLSMPSFNPNWFVRGITQTELDGLYQDIEKPLFNRPLQGIYPPGSTIKPMLGLAALHYRLPVTHNPLYCTGEYRLPGGSHRYRDWKPEGHRWMNLSSAIEQSCDVYFYELARELKIDRLSHFLSDFGLGQKVGIDLPGEKSGTLPSREWKRNAFKEREQQTWYPGETIIAGIGQGYFQTTPLQLAYATSLMANQGQVISPHLDQASYPSVVPLTPLAQLTQIEPRHWQAIHQSMEDVMHGVRGTARGSGRGLTYQMAGKTGTAQVYTVAQDETYDKDNTRRHLRDHALFIGFAPLDNPELAIAVVVEHGGSGSAAAAPVARAIMDAYLAIPEERS